VFLSIEPAWVILAAAAGNAIKMIADLSMNMGPAACFD
jgi:hypothetical protein